MSKYKNKVAEKFTKILSFFGNRLLIKKNIQKTPLKGKILLMSAIISLFCSIISIYVYRDDSKYRQVILEDIITFAMYLLFAYDFIFTPNNCKTLIDLMKRSAFKKHKYMNETDIDKLNDKANTLSWNVMRFMSVGMVVYWGFMCIVPTLGYILYVLNTDEIDLNDVITPFPSLLLITAFNNDNTIILTLNIITQIIIYTLSLTLIGIWLLLETCSLVYICSELQYLSDIIENMDDNFIDKNGNNSNQTVICNLKLKHFLININRHHLIIIKKVKDVYNSLKISLLVYNQLICFHFSVVLFCMFQNNEISGKGKYVMAYLSTLGCYGMVCVMGQYLVNASEHLWNAVASNPWQNKPKWFKHAIQMLLIGTQKPLKMEPAGLYVLDLNFLLKVLQVSYSYCNLMLQFNNKKEKNM